MICVSHTSFRNLLYNHSTGWFFAIFRKSSARFDNNIQSNFSASETLAQNLDDFPVSTLPRDTSTIDTTTSVTITKSSPADLYAMLCALHFK